MSPVTTTDLSTVEPSTKKIVVGASLGCGAPKTAEFWAMTIQRSPVQSRRRPV